LIKRRVKALATPTFLGVWFGSIQDPGRRIIAQRRRTVHVTLARRSLLSVVGLWPLPLGVTNKAVLGVCGDQPA
jgi:hypothetical protein